MPAISLTPALRTTAVVLVLLSPARDDRAAAQTGPAPDVKAVAEVDREPILLDDLTSRLSDERRRDLANHRLAAFTPAAKRAALDRLIDRRRLSKEARVRALDQRPDVRRRIDAAVEELLATALLEEIAATADADPASLRAYYDAHLDEFSAPGRLRARHIVVRTEAEAVAARGKLLRSQDFARLADGLNIDSTRGKGGELGWIRRGVLVPAFERTILGLKVGEIGPVVQTSYGYHVAQVEEIEAATRMPFDAAMPDVRRRIVERAVDAVKSDLAKKHPARINAAVLEAIR